MEELALQARVVAAAAGAAAAMTVSTPTVRVVAVVEAVVFTQPLRAPLERAEVRPSPSICRLPIPLLRTSKSFAELAVPVELAALAAEVSPDRRVVMVAWESARELAEPVVTEVRAASPVVVVVVRAASRWDFSKHWAV
jgi:hypothetical protein